MDVLPRSRMDYLYNGVPCSILQKFANEDREAGWWASPDGRPSLKEGSVDRCSKPVKGPAL